MPSIHVPSSTRCPRRIFSIPPNGRMPARVPGAPVGFGGLGPDSPGERPVRFAVGGIGKDSYLDRGISERLVPGQTAEAIRLAEHSNVHLL
ncbi:MAG: hypothetical protein R3332_09545 [Pseudohongiellaceae bacterium]|nr:hypothetical protein [Pseudohongiellaceae bacterium]